MRVHTYAPCFHFGWIYVVSKTWASFFLECWFICMRLIFHLSWIFFLWWVGKKVSLLLKGLCVCSIAMRIRVKISVNHGFWVPKGFGLMDFGCSNKAFWCAWVYGRSWAWSRQSNSKKRARSTGSLLLSFFLSFLFSFFSKTENALETLFYHHRKAASLMWLLGFLTSGELKSSCYGPTIYSWSEEGLHIQAVAYDISSTCTPFPHPPPAVMFMRFFRCGNELGCIVDVMHQSKILHFLLHPMIVNVIHKCLMQQCQL